MGRRLEYGSEWMRNLINQCGWDWQEKKNVSADGKLGKDSEFSEILFKAYSWIFSFHRVFAITWLSLAQSTGLWRSSLGPSQGSQISRSTRSTAWEHSVMCLEKGSKGTYIARFPATASPDQEVNERRPRNCNVGWALQNLRQGLHRQNCGWAMGQPQLFPDTARESHKFFLPMRT